MPLRARLLHRCHRRLNAVHIIVRPPASSPQNNMHISIAPGLHNRRKPMLCHAHERMRRLRRTHRIHRHAHPSIRPILEAHGKRAARGKFAVELRLGCARANGAPGDEVGDVLRGDGVEELGADGYTEVSEGAKELPRGMQAFVDLEGAVNAGIVDQAFPSNGRPRFLCEVNQFSFVLQKRSIYFTVKYQLQAQLLSWRWRHTSKHA